jgi:hypothetical protein
MHDIQELEVQQFSADESTLAPQAAAWEWLTPDQARPRPVDLTLAGSN